MEYKLLEEMSKVLSYSPNYWVGDTLLKYKVIEDLKSYKKDLIANL